MFRLMPYQCAIGEAIPPPAGTNLKSACITKVRSQSQLEALQYYDSFDNQHERELNIRMA